MKIQQVLTELSIITAQLSDIKMQMVRAEITELDAKVLALEVLKKAVKTNIFGKAIEQWEVSTRGVIP